MRPRLLIAFSLLVLTPVALLAWLGVRSAANEQRLVRHQFEAVVEARLDDVDRGITDVIEDVERRLLGKLNPANLRDPPHIWSLTRSSPLLRQVFVVTPNGNLAYPTAGSTATDEEGEFIERTRKIWDGEAVLFDPTRAESIPSSAAQSSISRVGAGDSITALAARRDHGWIAWYWGEGLHLMFWRRAPGGGVFGAEVERVVLLSQIVASLPSGRSDAPRIVLVDSRDDPVYQWGAYEPKEGELSWVQRSLSYPLDAWRLEYFSSPEQRDAIGGTTRSITLLGGLALVLIALLGLGGYAYREYSRDLREAARRVGFVTQVSHELKTPLTNIRLYAELLEDEVDPESKAESQARVIVNESQRLSRLIENILSFSKHRNAQLGIKKLDVDVDEVIRATIEQFKPSLDAKNVRVVQRLDATAPMAADPDALGQILANLIGNVEKYAAKGEVLEIESRQDDTHTRITVADRGPGIPRAKREQVFEPFTRLENRLDEGVSGTGIGLAIARELARLHGGDLRIVDRERGAAFELHLPKEGTA